MVFVFGIDIPLVEMIFVLTLILIVLLGLLVYLVIGQFRLKRDWSIMIKQENVTHQELDLEKNKRKRKKKKETKDIPKTRKLKVTTNLKKIFRRSKTSYVASKGGDVVHEKNCPFAKNIGEERRVYFKSKTKAFNTGYKACSCIKTVREKRKRRTGKKRVIEIKPKMRRPKVKTVVKTVVRRPKKVYLASANGDTIHQENCPFAKKIGEKNKIYFKSKAKAFDQGYKACNCI
ncbi:MAG: hypothetical protein KJ597_06370 [Nanoarchaeota archaeon]|nr:hypothetical protein [Nanoarchaeota archaeon]MBU1623172.1 hypothetical protein [Nanoarchaeota archaeon]